MTISTISACASDSPIGEKQYETYDIDILIICARVTIGPKFEINPKELYMKPLLSALMLVVLSSAAFADPVIPPLTLDNFTLESKVSIAGMYTSNPDASELRLSLARYELTLKSPGDWRIYSSFNMGDYGDRYENWLEQMEFIYQPNKNWTLHIGRLFLAPGYMTPAQQYLETANYPREPWGYYGWGIQADGDLGNGYSIIAQVTGTAHSSFRNDANWEAAVFSGHIEKKFSDQFKLEAQTQLSTSGAQAVGVGFEYKPVEQLFFRGEVYKAWGDHTDTSGAWLLATYKPLKWFELHSQVDYRDADLGGHGFIVSPGMRFLLPQWQRTSLTVDYQFDTQGTSDGLYIRLQIGL